MENKEFFTITHHQPEIKTVGDFLFQDGLNVLKGQVPGQTKLILDVPAAEFLNYKNAAGLSNRDAVRARYTPAQLQQDHPDAALPLVLGTELVIPYAHVNREFLLTSGSLVVDTQQYKDMDYFLASQLKDLLEDQSYTRSYPTKKLTSVGNIREIYPLLTVWCWTRALSEDGTGQGRVVNLTPFVKSLTTNMTANGGNFNLELTPLQGTFGPAATGGVTFDFGGRTLISASNTTGYLTSSVVGGDTRAQSFLHTLIGQNDLVFIRFEQADGEERNEAICNNFIIPPAELAGQLYDMIALVDTNTLNTNAEGAQTLQIRGRDCMKLLIEDGSYFYPLEFADGMFYNSGNRDNGADSLILRNMASGKLMTAALYLQRSVEFSLRFILQHLSNLSVAPDALFDGWGSRRTTRFAASVDETYNEKRRTWAKEKDAFLVHGQRAVGELRLNENLARPEQPAEISLRNQVFSTLINFVEALDKAGVLRLGGPDQIAAWGATVYENEQIGPNDLPRSFENKLFAPHKTGEKYLVAGSKEALDNAYGYLDRRRKLENFEGAPYHERPAKGLWSIIKVEIDPSVSQRRVVDASIASEQGSILNSIRKLCHDPFIQFSGDTYGDQYYFTVRQAPFTKEAMLKATTGGGYLQIRSEDVLNDSLLFTTEAYSWYRLTPKASLMGSGEQLTLAYLPAIYFPEYAAVYGSKPLDLTTNYIPYSGLVDSQNKVNQNYVEKQAFYDLKYLIDSHSYLPFTRQGTITTLPNRGVKRGMFITYAPTGELFYVDDVTQNYALSDGGVTRTTTLTVSRGMVQAYMDGPGPTYFSIVETPLQDNQFDGNGGRDGVFDNWRVNKPHFDFFQRRGQFNSAPIQVGPAPVYTRKANPKKPQRRPPQIRG